MAIYILQHKKNSANGFGLILNNCAQISRTNIKSRFLKSSYRLILKVVSNNMPIAWELHVQKESHSQAAEDRGEFEINNPRTTTQTTT